jgi:two-component system, NarL family, response regulator LiaR
MKKIVLADNQDLTKAGWIHILNDFDELTLLCEVTSKSELFPLLKSESNLIVIFDYALFDFESVHNLILLQTTYPDVEWIICSDDLNEDFFKLLVSNTHTFSVFTKNTTAEEIKIGIKEILKGNRFICNYVSNSLLQNSLTKVSKTEKTGLTATEKEILKDIASGRTTKEIASKRYISIHTVMTHRKNIFRKIEVNNIHEATKYAMRAGLIDMADYYI